MLCFIGTTELLVIGGIALLLFGGKKLPEMMRGLGKGVKEFKEGVNGVGEDVAESSQPNNTTEETSSDSQEEVKNE